MKHISRAIEHWKRCGLAGSHGTGVWVIVIQRETCGDASSELASVVGGQEGRNWPEVDSVGLPGAGRSCHEAMGRNLKAQAQVGKNICIS